jgi:hypothetical protein
MPVVVLFKDFYVEAHVSATFSVPKSSLAVGTIQEVRFLTGRQAGQILVITLISGGNKGNAQTWAINDQICMAS